MSHPRHAGLLLLALLLTFTPGETAHAQGEAREPGPGAKPHHAYEATSSAGLRYTWAIPKDVPVAGERGMTVLLHGTGLDYRWGFANHPIGKFRPHDVVISVDGTSPGQGGSRLFLDQKKDLEGFHEFLNEMREKFEVDRIFLYGHSQGGFFVARFAGDYPDGLGGVVAHASGAWASSKTKGDVQKVPLVFLHGTADPVVPYTNSTGSIEHYRKQGYDLARLRPIPEYNHWPNAVRTAEAITWCEGMITARPAVAIAAAEELIRPKGVDAQGLQMAVDYSGAASILSRFGSKSKQRLEGVGKREKRRASSLSSVLEKEFKAHRKVLQKSMRRGLKLDGGAWLGHLLALREDMRGVPGAEKLFKSLKIDAVRKEHAVAAGRALRPWYDGKSPAEIYAAAVRELPNAFLYDAFPHNYGEKLRQWHGQADTLGIDPKLRAQFPLVEAWLKGLDEGKKAYAGVWKNFRP